MQCSLRYGRGELTITLPDDADVHLIRKPEMPTLEDPVAAVHAAFKRPVTASDVPTVTLKQRAAQASSACIAICDITRPVPNHLFLRPLIETLREAGVPADRITIVVATGLHRPNLGPELAELIGDPWVLEQTTIVNHDATCDSDHVDLGKTPTRGTPVKIDRRFAQADLRIATGLVEPHFMAGYSGGRKVIAPGLAHADTIKTFHNHAFMSDPEARNCNLDENPLHQEQLEIVRMIGGAYALNTVIDEQRQLSFVNFGEITASHQQAVNVIGRYCRVEVPHAYDTVVTSAAGYPLDKTYYQTVKGMVGPMEILRPGGDLIIASQCSEGVGSPAFMDAQRRLTQLGPSDFLATLAGKPLADADEWQSQMQTKVMQRGRIHLYSSLAAEQRMLTGVEPTEDIDATIRQSLRRHGKRSVAVIPEGPYVIPFVGDERVPPIGTTMGSAR
ncbi:nickel-dependent lactate racemase [Roseiconus nitratireducens]|uniref:Nickel-dependent lactate racemase n=1 Tax=Roseiconus nitratireducens TaxID=2605748 RepID=A0A5M6D0A6_9BACT|nr:nickel-dependent lactate racemase [Roseiconus nitratireducens]KAA5540911.1 nickel-dependent lactate racemase [Roseiconus nitratireducens]